MSYTPIPSRSEDSPHTDGDAGVPILAVRRDADSAAVSADGDYASLLVNSEGRLKTAGAPAQFLPVTGAVSATQAVANTPIANATVFADVTQVSNVMAYVTGTFAAMNVTFEGSLDSTNGTDGTWFTIQAVRSNANTVETTTGSLSAAPTYAWELSVNALLWFRVRCTARTSGTQNWRFILGSYATEPIPAVQAHAVTVTGTVTASSVTGNVASNAADSGNPVKTGGVAYVAVNPPVVSNGSRVNFIADRVGKQVVVGSIRDLKASTNVTLTATTTETTLIPATASILLDIYGLIIENTSATGTEVVFRDSLAGSVQFSIYVPATDTRGFMLPESGAFKQTTVNTPWTAQCTTSVSSIKITALYVKNI